MYIAATATITLYILATISQVINCINSKKTAIVVYLFGVFAVIMHGYLLYRWIDLASGQNLYFLNLLSLIFWIISGILLVSSWHKPVINLLVLVFPVAALSLFAVVFFPGNHILQVTLGSKQFFHILCSILAFSVICVAALQALALSMQDYLIQNKRAIKLLQILPALETMESLLFEIIGLGFILLSIVLVSSICLFYAEFAQWIVPYSSLFAWVIFAGLLWGRCFRAWRGRIAIHGTSIGMILLVMAYFGHWLWIR